MLYFIYIKYIVINGADMSKKRKILKWFGIIASVILLIIALAFWATSGLLTPVENQIYAIKRGDLNDAYAFTSKQFQQNTSFNQFQQFVNANPVLKNNKSMSFNERTIDTGIGTLSGRLTAFDGTITPVQYKLVKENDDWKILSIEFMQAGIAREQDLQMAAQPTPALLTNLYEQKELGYQIKYSNDWDYKQATPQSLVFYKKNNSNNSFATLNIQVFLNKKLGGFYSSYQEALDDYENQLKQADPNARIIERGPMSLHGYNNTVLDGKYFVIEYNADNRMITQAQFIVETKDNQLFYSLGYTATSSDYEINKDLVGEMLKSFQQIK